MAVRLATPLPAAELIPAAQQNLLVAKYCAVCHTDAAKNGGLSLQHYDAAQANPPLAAMLLSKLRNGAMGAAGLGTPDPATDKAWVAATAAQAEQAIRWSVIRTDASGSKGAVLSASVVRYVSPRKQGQDSPIYRLTLACDAVTRKGEILLTWSPAPQTDRTFSISVDANAGTPHRLEGRETMCNGADLTSGLASVLLKVPLPEKTLTVTDLFPDETVVFPLGELDRVDRGQLAICLAAPAGL
jgi:hypothetical protein